VYRIYRDAFDRWHVESDMGDIGGIFISERAARWFARTEAIQWEGTRLVVVAKGGSDEGR